MTGPHGSPDSLMLDWQVLPGKPAVIDVAGLTGIDEACAWLRDSRSELRGGLDRFGAAYIRGLGVTTVKDFARVRDVLIPEATPYREKATPRSDYGDGLFSSTDLPPSQSIGMHNENSYTLTFPGLLLFGCLIAPREGGATPVADCRKALAALPADMAERTRAVGWLLTRNYSEYISIDWKTAFSAGSSSDSASGSSGSSGDPADVERYCAENLIGYDWQPDGNLRTSQLRPGIISHPSTGDEVWFNHLAFWNEWSLDEELRQTLVDEFGRDGLPFNTSFGDGLALSEEELRTVRAAYDAATVRETWQPGDLLLVDNILTAHGRDAFRGDRQIVVAMGQPVNLADCHPTVDAAPAAPAAAKNNPLSA